MPITRYEMKAGVWAPLASGPPVVPPAQTGKVIFGMAHGADSGLTAEQSYVQANADKGPLYIRRSFHSGTTVPADFAHSGAGFDIHKTTYTWGSWTSFKAPLQEVIDGTHDTEIKTYAASYPKPPHVSLNTFWHEPEDDFPGQGPLFVAASKRVYALFKSVAPWVMNGPIAMSFQFDPQQGPGHANSPKYVANPDDWFVGTANVDFLAVDTYAGRGTDSSKWVDFKDHAGHMRWFNWASKKGLLLKMGEFGCQESASDPNFKARWLGTQMKWLTENGFSHASYFDSIAADGTNWVINTPQALAAWKDGQSKYGRTP